nr:hypothetical protein [Pyrococcus sp. ST04]
MEKKVKIVALLVIIIGLFGVLLTIKVKHYQGGEIYEAANDAMNWLSKGFNVTVRVESVDGKILEGEVFAARGSTIIAIVNGSRVTIGGPSASKEEVKAKHIEVIVRGRVYVYEVPPTEGEGFSAFGKYEKKGLGVYSERFSGTIYVENISLIDIGKLKYEADYTTFGSLTIKGIYGNNAILVANMVPIDILKEGLRGKRVFFYGLLIVNSEERTLPLKIVEVRSK